MVGIVNLKWRDAMSKAGHAFTDAEQKAGWPIRMSAPQLAALQRPRYFTPLSRMLNPKIPDPGEAAGHERNKACNTLWKALQAEFDAGHGPGTAALFAAWLAANGEQPSPLVVAWFEAMGQGHALPPATRHRPGERWTPEQLAELRAYRTEHGTAKAAEAFDITAARVRTLLPSEKPPPKGYSAFNHR